VRTEFLLIFHLKDNKINKTLGEHWPGNKNQLKNNDKLVNDTCNNVMLPTSSLRKIGIQTIKHQQRYQEGK
jgi:hypothetical protein